MRQDFYTDLWKSPASYQWAECFRGLEPDSLGFILGSTTYCVTWGRFLGLLSTQEQNQILRS